MADPILKMSILGDCFGICRLAPDMSIPEWALAGDFVSITKTNEELSVVCRLSAVPDGVKVEGDWKALKVEGHLDFSLTGILASISAVLAKSKISIFAVSTFDTDYILVRGFDLDTAVEVLRRESYDVMNVPKNQWPKEK